MIYTPRYVLDFKCIADRCRHSCCVGWEIDIDDKTYERYKSIGSEICQGICELDGTRSFVLTDGRCPHLTEKGLCDIITEYGEGYLCDICREHPRFYNESSRGVEVGLGMACEEAARIILSSDGYRDFAVVGESEGEPCATELDAMGEIERMYGILAAEGSYVERLARIYREWGISPCVITDGEWRELLSGLEYLNPEHADMLCAYSSELRSLGEYDKLSERALAYFVYRHCASAGGAADFRASLGLALFLERLFASVLRREGVKNLEGATRVARIISEELEYSEENTDIIRLEFIF
jgi:lysine-N-methylase